MEGVSVGTPTGTVAETMVGAVTRAAAREADGSAETEAFSCLLGPGCSLRPWLRIDRFFVILVEVAMLVVMMEVVVVVVGVG